MAREAAEGGSWRGNEWTGKEIEYILEDAADSDRTAPSLRSAAYVAGNRDRLRRVWELDDEYDSPNHSINNFIVDFYNAAKSGTGDARIAGSHGPTVVKNGI